MTTAQLPSDVTRCLNAHELNHRPVLLSTNSDIALSGDNRRNWLVVTADHFSVVSEPETTAPNSHPKGASTDSNEATLVRAMPVGQIKAVRTWAGLGSGVLQVRTEDTWIDLQRYSNAHAERFHKVSRKLDVFCSGGELTVHADEQLDAHRCGGCGLRLSSAVETCPRCVHRSQILSRV